MLWNTHQLTQAQIIIKDADESLIPRILAYFELEDYVQAPNPLPHSWKDHSNCINFSFANGQMRILDGAPVNFH